MRPERLQQILNELRERLVEHYGDRLVGIVLSEDFVAALSLKYDALISSFVRARESRQRNESPNGF